MKEKLKLAHKSKAVEAPENFGGLRSGGFESSLFREGSLNVDLDGVLLARKRRLEQFGRWMEEQPYWTHKDFCTVRRNYTHEFVWLKRFMGRVPRHWDNWGDIRRDFERARSRRLSLSSTLVEAGISYPNELLASEVARGQRLNVKQMGRVFVRHNLSAEMSRGTLEEIISSQKLMGMDDRHIEASKRLAERVSSFVKKKAP